MGRESLEERREEAVGGEEAGEELAATREAVEGEALPIAPRQPVQREPARRSRRQVPGPQHPPLPPDSVSHRCFFFPPHLFLFVVVAAAARLLLVVVVVVVAEVRSSRGGGVEGEGGARAGQGPGQGRHLLTPRRGQRYNCGSGSGGGGAWLSRRRRRKS